VNINPNHWVYRAACGSTLVFCAFLCGCAGAVRMPVRASGPAGATLAKSDVDLKFLQVGTTHREEVENHLAGVDTSYANPRLFWGRWSESRWGYWWVVGMPCNNCMAGDAKRKWHVQNLLVAFDENGLIAKKKAIGDDKILWIALHSYMLEAAPPPLNITEPIRLALLGTQPQAILLSPDSMEFESGPGKKKANVRISPLKLIRFSHGRTHDKRTSVEITCHALEFSEKTVYGQKIKFCASADQIGVLFEYLQQVGPAGMNWQ